MPPKTESTELAVFTLDNLNPALLPELATFKAVQLKVVKDNPFVVITDAASRDLAKKYRTARVSARTALQGQDKLISSKFNEAKTKAKTYIAELIELTQPGELEQQKEIDRDEAVLEEKRNEKARIEKERIDNIKAELDKYFDEWKDAFNLMTFQTIENIGDNFVESYTTYDTAILQEFESLFPTKVEELTKILMDKKVSLTEAENARLEKARLEEESQKLAKEKAELAAKQKLANEAEAKAKKEREDFEKEKVEFSKNKRILDRKNTLSDLGINENIVLPRLGVSVHGMLMNILVNGSDNDFKIECDYVIKRIAELDAKKSIITEKVEIPEILVPENSTVNVCTSLEREKVNCIASRLVSIENEINLAELKKTQSNPTWKTIQEEFKASGQKSYSVWLEKNYNVPTKI